MGILDPRTLAQLRVQEFVKKYASRHVVLDKLSTPSILALDEAIQAVFTDRPSDRAPIVRLADEPQHDPHEAAALAAGWRHGGDFDGFWYDGNRFATWKEATSADDAATYATAMDVCHFENLVVK